MIAKRDDDWRNCALNEINDNHPQYGLGLESNHEEYFNSQDGTRSFDHYEGIIYSLQSIQAEEWWINSYPLHVNTPSSETTFTHLFIASLPTIYETAQMNESASVESWTGRAYIPRVCI